jgi:glycosyltransferase involved in cell wall biosynthesis
MAPSQRPLVSIVVATYNVNHILPHCLESIRQQTYPDKEIIVVDGASSDGTVETIKRSPGVTRWISEPDNGIYNAWNKALRLAQGEWICFLGADDVWASPDSLSCLVAVAESSGADYAVAKGKRVNSQGKAIGSVGGPWNWTRMKRWQGVLHPGSLHRKSLFERYGDFNDFFRIAADYDFLLRLGGHAKVAFLDKDVISIGDNGVSRKRIKQVLKETWVIQKKHAEIGWTRATANYIVALLKSWVRGVTCGSS